MERSHKHLLPLQYPRKRRKTKRLERNQILPLWHGSSETAAQSVAESGFVYFGKASLGGTKTKSTDEGFFGSGIYFTNSARYAADIYSSGHLLMAWVSMREPFPVVGDDPQSDMNTLKGKGAYKAYNAHYVPVASTDPSNPYESYYYPTKPGQDPHCDEIVVFHKSQAIPRFWVEIEVEVPYLMTPSNIPQFVNELIPHLFKMLENQNVDRDQKLRNHLEEELGFLLKLKGNDYLDDHSDKYNLLYGQLTQLIDTQGKVNRNISRTITGASLPQSTIPKITQQIQQINLQSTIQQSSPNSFLRPTSYPTITNSQPQLPNTPISPQKTLPTIPNQTIQSLNPFSSSLSSSSFIQSSIPIIQPSSIVQLPPIAFGKAKWATYFGDIGQEPPLPNNIQQILSSPCPFWPNKKVEETHMLVLIPVNVNGKPLTVKSLGKLVKAPKQGNASKYSYFDLGKYKAKDLPVPKSYWVLMTRDVLEGTRSISYAEQTKIVAGFRQKTGIHYEVPRVLEATVCIFMIHASTGTKLYGDSPFTYTRCQEVYREGWQLVAGDFAAAGLDVYDGYRYYSYIDRSYIGVGGVRKLC